MDDSEHLSQEVAKLRSSLSRLPEPVAQPFLVLVSGLPGTGKSHFCHKLAERVPVVILESDALRRVLFPSPGYTQSESAHLFQVIHLLIEQLLKEHIPLALDATNLSEKHRQHLYNIADRLKARLIIAQMKANPELVRRRLEERFQAQQRIDSSEAGWTVYQKMKPSQDRIRRNHFVVDASRDIAPVLDKIVRELRR
ncbi:MAG: ATP-binding protein [Chloroflexi bacterium]|nr:ATP-binding protein [Chloroflexota bacterium]